MVTVTIETRLSGEKNDIRVAGLTLLRLDGKMEQVYWNPFPGGGDITITELDDEQNRITVINPRLVGHRNVTDDVILKAFDEAYVLDATIYRTSTMKTAENVKFDVVEATDGDRIMSIDWSVHRSFWRSAKTAAMRAIEGELDDKYFDYLKVIEIAKDVYAKSLPTPPPFEHEDGAVGEICLYMFERYYLPFYKSVVNDEPLDQKVFQGLDIETREALRGHIKVNTLTKSEPFVFRGGDRLTYYDD